MEERKREAYLDIAKGIGIILVILGHIDVGFATTWFYSFDLPVFFVVTGICFRYRDSFVSYLKSKARRCLIPYTVFGILIVLVESKTGYLYETGLKPNFVRLVKQERYSTLWFLATLFVASLMFYWIVRVCRQNAVLVLVVSVVLSAIFVYLDQNHIRALPWNVDTAFIVLAFIGAGYFIKNFKGIIDNLIRLSGGRKIIAVVAFLLVNLFAFAGNLIVSHTSLEMYWNSYGNYVFMLIAALSGTLFVLIVSSSIKYSPLETLGRNSMIYFAIHQSVIMWPMTLFLRKIKMITYAPSVKNYISKVILFVAIIIICALLDKIIRSTKLKFILGE